MSPLQRLVSSISKAPTRRHAEDGVAPDEVQGIGLRTTSYKGDTQVAAGRCDARKAPWRIHEQGRSARGARGSPRCSGDDEGRDEELQAIVAGGEKLRQTSLANCRLKVWDGAGSDIMGSLQSPGQQSAPPHQPASWHTSHTSQFCISRAHFTSTDLSPQPDRCIELRTATHAHAAREHAARRSPAASAAPGRCRE